MAAHGQERTKRVGVLLAQPEHDPQAQSWFALFRKSMIELGWMEQRNLVIDHRWTGAEPERARQFAAELVKLAPDVLFATNTVTLEALRRATAEIPVVFVQVSDPAGNGFVQNISKPGGNITGFAHFDYEIAGKWLEVLKELAPAMTRAGSIYGLENPASPKYLAVAQNAGSRLGVTIVPKGVRDGLDIDRAFGEIVQTAVGLLVQPSPLTIRQRDQIIGLAQKHRMPAVYPFRFFAVEGGLASYGVDTAWQYHQAATYISRILRGERVGDLPVQNPTKFELVVNMRSAKAIGLAVPPSLLARADEVIE
jgi:putative ABC transport system substrate-binding protein